MYVERNYFSDFYMESSSLLWVERHTTAGSNSNRARLLEVELQAVVSRLMCVLGTELGFSA